MNDISRVITALSKINVINEIYTYDDTENRNV